jgi:quercetin dioxygenase-like cupin family protein
MSLIDLQDTRPLDVLGAIVEHLTPLDAAQPCVLRGTLPAGVVVPLHSHPDAETFIVQSGELAALAGDEWITLAPGAVFHVPPDAPHAWRTVSQAPAVATIVTTARLGRFLHEVGRPFRNDGATAWPPEPGAIARLAATAARYGHWLATPAENAAIGIELA